MSWALNVVGYPSESPPSNAQGDMALPRHKDEAVRMSTGEREGGAGQITTKIRKYIPEHPCRCHIAATRNGYYRIQRS